MYGALALFGVFEVTFWFPAVWALGVAVILMDMVATGFILTNVDRIPRGWWHTLVAPLLLAVSALLLSLFVSTAAARQLLVVLTCVLNLFFWENLRRYYWDPDRYHDQSLENVSLALNTTTMWFTSALFYNILLDPSVLPPTLANNVLALATFVVLLIVFFVDFGTIWVQRYPTDKVWLWLIAVSVVVSEVFWVTNFLPHRVEVKTFLVVLVYYLLTHVGRSYLDNTMRPAILRRYAYFALGCLVVVLLTARWLV